MQVKDFDNYQPPRRKPWLLMAVIAAFAIFAWRTYFVDESISDDPGDTTDNPVLPVDEPLDILRPDPIDDHGSPQKPQVSGGEINSSIQKAGELEKRGNLVGARGEYLKLLEKALPANVMKTVESKLSAINIALVMTPRIMPEKIEHTVVGGDSLQKIANKYGTTVLLIQECNNLANPNLIRAGYNLKVFTGKFTILVSKKRNDLLLYMNGEFFKRYLVGTGKFGKTPVGTYTITDKIAEPVWWRDDGKEIPFTGDPKGENILGTRWMALTGQGNAPRKGYGIHGTWDESSIGKAESAGCVRMRNKEVEELFILLPMKTVVIVEE